MITHTPFTIGERYALLGSFDVPSVQGKFEVRSLTERVERPLFIVVHEKWKDASRRERIAPVVVVQFEADGRQRCINQREALPKATVDFEDFTRRVLRALRTHRE